MRSILEKLRRQEVTVDEAERMIRPALLDVAGVAVFDLGRHARTGIPEVILAEGKTLDQLRAIVDDAAAVQRRVLISRLDEDLYRRLTENGASLTYFPTAKIAVLKTGPEHEITSGGRVGIITAGTSDFPVAEEARIVAEQLGCQTRTAYDVGVAGVHRLFPGLKPMIEERTDVYIVAAGREGALPTLVAGLVHGPVIGLPVSNGYGIGGNGTAALLAMLQACSPLVVVNIDAGFVAGAVAAQIANKIADARNAQTEAIDATGPEND